MCICTHIHIYMYTYIHVVCIIEFVGLSVLDVLYWCPTSLLCAYIHIYIYTYIHIFIYSYTHIYTNTYIHIYMLYVSSSSCVSMCSSSWDVKDSLGGWRAFVFSSRGSRCARVHAWCQVCGSVCALEFVGRKWLIGWVTFVSGLEFICRFEFVGLCVLEFICDVEFVGLFRVVGMWVTCWVVDIQMTHRVRGMEMTHWVIDTHLSALVPGSVCARVRGMCVTCWVVDIQMTHWVRGMEKCLIEWVTLILLEFVGDDRSQQYFCKG